MSCGKNIMEGKEHERNRKNCEIGMGYVSESEKYGRAAHLVRTILKPLILCEKASFPCGVKNY